MHTLEISDLHVSVEGKTILKGISLTLKQGEIHAMMGPNGSGKSTLGNALMGNPRYKVERGNILLDGEDITHLKPDERAAKGLFLAFQYPAEISGVSLGYFLRSAYKAVHPKSSLSVMEFHKLLLGKMKLLGMDRKFADRYLNEGFSGGEKKRSEILQLALLQPKFALLDETDSGLDIDALRKVSEGINKVAGGEMGILLITHYQRILRYVKPNCVHVLIDGRIVKSGGRELADELEEKGYDHLIRGGKG